MTGYKDEDFTYKGYDLEVTEEEEWTVRVYASGQRLFTVSCRRKQVAIRLAKLAIEYSKATELQLNHELSSNSKGTSN